MAQTHVKLTKSIARKVLSIVDAGLVSGLGNPVPGELCIEAAVCLALGEPHGDEPSCVSPALRAFKIGLNDAAWSSPLVRAAGLRRLAVAQLGTADTLDHIEFSRRVAMLSITEIVPRVLRLAASMKMPKQHSEALLKAANDCEAAADLNAARAARAASCAASYASYASCAASYASYASYASDAASAASEAARAARAASCAASYASDQELATAAEAVVQILIAMKTPGSKWLDLAPLQAAA